MVYVCSKNISILRTFRGEPALRKEDGDESKEHEDDQHTQQHSSHHSEVHFRLSRKVDEVCDNDPLPDFEQKDYVLLANLERKDGEREDDDGGDARRDDHCVRVVLHAHLVISMLGKGNVF